MGWELKVERVAGANSRAREKGIVHRTMSYE